MNSSALRQYNAPNNFATQFSIIDVSLSSLIKMETTDKDHQQCNEELVLTEVWVIHRIDLWSTVSKTILSSETSSYLSFLYRYLQNNGSVTLNGDVPLL